MSTETEIVMSKITMWLLGIVQVCVVGLIAFLINTDSKLDDEIDTLREYSHENYALREDVKDMKKELLAALGKMSTQIESLRDK